jgi:hypothetical protein
MSPRAPEDGSAEEEKTVDVRSLVNSHPQFKDLNLNAGEIDLLQQSANALLRAPKGQNLRVLSGEVAKYEDDARGRELLTILTTRVLNAVLDAKGELQK